MSIPTSQAKYLPAEVIVDSKIIHKNLTSYGLNMQWLENQLKHQGISSVDDIFYAEIQADGSLYIAPKN